MESSLIERAKRFLSAQRKKKMWYRAMYGMAAIVVFVTTYMLILPAITMERETICGKEEHTHTEECYTTEIVEIEQDPVLICTAKTLEIHKHTDSCYTKNENDKKVLTCGQADFVLHTHDKNCYNEAGDLVCTLDEVKEHIHDNNCYETKKVLVCEKQESAGHSHTKDCYTKEKGSLICDAEEHTHGGTCYDENGNLICEKEEHTHSDKCYKWEDKLVCSKEESEGHSHDDSCYETVKTLKCSKKEAYVHKHTDNCYKNGVLTCGKLETAEHQHSEACFETPEPETEEKTVLVCEKDEHVHEDECFAEETEAANTFSLRKTTETAADEEGESQIDEAVQGNDGIMLLDEGESETSGESSLSTEEESESKTSSSEEQTSASASEENTTENTTDVLNVNKVSFNTLKYDADNDWYLIDDLRIDFTVEKEDIAKTLIYTYPNSVIIPDALLNTLHDLTDDSGNVVGTYKFIANYDDAGNIINYSVEVNFNADYIAAVTNDVTGHITFDGMIDKSAVNGEGDVEVKFSDSCTLYIPGENIEYPDDETLNYDVNVIKEGSVIEGNKLVYTVYIDSEKGTPDSISISDTLNVSGIDISKVSLESVTVTEGTYKKYSNWSGNRIDGESTTLVNEDDYKYSEGNLTLTLDGLEKAASNDDGSVSVNYYKIVYIYDLGDLDAGEYITSKNAVTISSTDDSTGETIKDSDDYTLNVDQTYKMSKYGSHEGDGKIKWTITVNSNNNNIAGTVLTDSMLADLTGDVTISPADGYEIIKDADGTITGIQFNAITDTNSDGTADSNTNAYTITYYTDVVTSWDTVTYKNEASLNDSDGDKLASGTGTVYVGDGSVSKQYTSAVVSEDKETSTVTWTITITLPESGLEARTEIVDNPNQNQWGNAGKNQYFTREQILAWDGILTFDDGITVNVIGNDNFTLSYLGSDGNKYTYDDIKSLSEDTNITFTVMTITLISDLKAPENSTSRTLTYSYTTTADLTDASYGNNSYYNTISVGDKKNHGEYVYHKGGVLKTDGNGNSEKTTVSNSTGELTWRVTTYVDSDNYEYMIVTDTLPAGITLTALKLGVEQFEQLTIAADGAISGTDGTYNVTGTYKDGKVELKVTPVSGSYLPTNTDFRITYFGKVTDVDSTEASQTFKNTVSVKTDTGAEYGSDSQEQKWSKSDETAASKHLSKSGDFNNNSQKIEYSVIINQNGDDLVEGSDTLTLTDVLSYTNPSDAYPGLYRHYSLIQSSVKLYYYSASGDKTEVTDWSWTYTEEDGHTDWTPNKCTINAIVPDGVALILEYAYSVEATYPSDWATNPLGVSNTVTIEGTGESSTDDKVNDNWKQSETTGSVITDKTYRFYKVEEGNYNIILQGAVFTLYKYVALDTWEEVKTYTTDKNGSFYIILKEQDEDEEDGLKTNTLYKLVETTAPDGYKLPASEIPYYFYFSSDTDTTNTLPDLPASAVDLSKTSATAYVENEKIPEDEDTSIKTTKVWKDLEGNELTTDLPESIQFKLYQVCSETEITETVTSGGELYKTESNPDGIYTITAEEDWTLTVSDLPAVRTVDGVTTYYAYYLKEVELDDYASEITVNDDGSYTITNTKADIEKTEITVNKVWKNSDGVTITKAEGEVNFALYQAEGNEDLCSITIMGVNSYNEPSYCETLKEFQSVKGSTITINYSFGKEYHHTGITVNGESISYTNNGTYSCTFVVQEDSVVKIGTNFTEKGYVIVNEVIVAEPEDSSSEETSGILYTTDNGTGIYTLSGPNWVLKIDDLPANKIDKDGNVIATYTYFVREISTTVSGDYDITYEVDEDGTLLIVNQATEENYELPETGGSGTLQYILGGFLLMLVSILMYIKKQNQKRGKRI